LVGTLKANSSPQKNFQADDVEMEEMEVESNLVPSSFSAERLALVEDIDKVRPHFSVGATTKCIYSYTVIAAIV
jgi:hypothetical protein